jgi:glycosyltransferase involved in cell wall biosynthesis
MRFDTVSFVSTFAPKPSPSNVKVIGIQPHKNMKAAIQRAGVYLSTTKETFGIGVLEALAAGVPVLGYAHGGNLDIVKHGVNGYLARPGDIDDLSEGLIYCMQHRSVLSSNALVTVRDFTWEKACDIVAGVYRLASQPEFPTVSIIIPSYNYADKVGRAIESAIQQNYEHLEKIIVVDDGSSDDGATERVVKQLAEKDDRVVYVYQDNAGVANARNTGIASCNSKYVCCLDADDAIDPRFIGVCVEALEKDRTLGIAYTGLWFIEPDGKEGLSQWPGEFNYNEQLQKRNQIPTCCVFRKIMWERLGGYKQRYAPQGAGAEDAEFWLRAGAYGYGAKKVTDAGLFIYSWKSGRVSGSREYKEVDWTELHPWTKDGKHPFASRATPKNNFSHPVRQYDSPIVSVVIPVGEGHKKEITNALDSLESQSFRNWEAVVVDDTTGNNTPDLDWQASIKKVYPYIRFVNSSKHGAGAARNAGAKIARAPLLLFLDADDWLVPDALTEFINGWNTSSAIVYSDYIGKAYMEYKDVEQLGNRLLHYSEKSKEAVVAYKAFDFDCVKAQQQPTKEFYIWCLVSALVPKAWHDEIGGFDENMQSWEDWDYWIRMARAGKCFNHLDSQLVIYRFYTGSRRDAGVKEHQSLVKYLLTKYASEGKSVSPCNCGGRKPSGGFVATTAKVVPAQSQSSNTESAKMSDDNFVLIEYTSLNRGQHKVVGTVTHKVYGYRAGGDIFYVDKRDVAANPYFKQVQQSAVQPVIEQAPQQTQPPQPIGIATPAATPVANTAAVMATKATETVTQPQQPVENSEQAQPFDIVLLPGVTPLIAQQLRDMEVKDYSDIVSIGMDGLEKLRHVGATRAKIIYDYCVQQMSLR